MFFQEDFELPVTIALAVFVFAIFMACCFYNFCSKRSMYNRRNGRKPLKHWIKTACRLQQSAKPPSDAKGQQHDQQKPQVKGRAANLHNGKSPLGKRKPVITKKTFSQKALLEFPKTAFYSNSKPTRNFESPLSTIREEDSCCSDQDDSDEDTCSCSEISHVYSESNYFNV